MSEYLKFKKLLSQSMAIDNMFIDIDELRSNSDCDKLGFGFSKTNKYCACECLPVYVSSYRGFYGNSGCTTIISLDNDIFNDYLMKVLNKNFTKIMQEVSSLISSDANILKDEAIKELTELIKDIDSFNH